MKKIKNLFLAVISIGVLAPCLSSCMKKSGGANSLTILLHEAGYQHKFLFDLADAYNDSVDEEDELVFDIQYNQSATQTFQNDFETDYYSADMYFVLNTGWSNFAITHKLEKLDDVFEEVEDFMDQDVIDGCNILVDGEKHPYVCPWTAGPSGIVYSKKLFDEKGWEVPTTVTELKALIKTIEADGTVTPFGFSPQDYDYLSYLMNTWWLQVDGMEGWKTFWEFGDKSVFDTLGRHVALDTFYNLFNDNDVLDTKAYRQYSNLKDTEGGLVKGEIAMMVNQSCFYQECKDSFGSELRNGNFKMMETPIPERSFIVNNDPVYYGPWDGSLKLENGAYCPTWDIIVIPSMSAHKENAKKFLKFINSSEGNKIFAKSADTIRPINNVDLTKVHGISNFLKSCCEISNENKVVQDIISSPMYYVNAGQIKAWPGNSKPWLCFALDDKAIRKNVPAYLAEMKSYVDYNWADWVEKARRS